METLNIVEKFVSIICPIISVIISIIALFKSNDAIKQINKIKIGKIEKKQVSNNNDNSIIMQSMK